MTWPDQRAAPLLILVTHLINYIDMIVRDQQRNIVVTGCIDGRNRNWD